MGNVPPVLRFLNSPRKRRKISAGKRSYSHIGRKQWCQSRLSPHYQECLRVSWFQNLFEARRQIAAWRKEYNEERPHSSLGYLTPNEYAAEKSKASYGKDAGQKAASLENAKSRVSHFPTAPAAGILQIQSNHQHQTVV
jgi:hypothetical protein